MRGRKFARLAGAVAGRGGIGWPWLRLEGVELSGWRGVVASGMVRSGWRCGWWQSLGPVRAQQAGSTLGLPVGVGEQGYAFMDLFSAF